MTKEGGKGKAVTSPAKAGVQGCGAAFAREVGLKRSALLGPGLRRGTDVLKFANVTRFGGFSCEVKAVRCAEAGAEEGGVPIGQVKA
jgi:hypothetical protein